MPSSWTASSAGRPPSPAPRTSSWTELGQHRYGSELMNITADATLPGALGTFGYDDEGTPAQCVADRRSTASGSACSPAATRPSIAGLPPGGHGARRRLQPAPDGADDQRRSARRRLIARGDDRRHRRRDLHGHQPLVVDRRQAAQLPVRLRDRLGDQEGQAGPHAQEPDLHRDHAQVLGAAGHARRGRRVGPLGHAQLRQGPADADRPHRPLGLAGAVHRACAWG